MCGKKSVMVLCFFLLMWGEAFAQQSVVTFTFDDASTSQYDNAFRIMKKHSLEGTLFVATKGVDTDDSFNMSWENIREMAAAGWEIGSHTYSHADLRLVDDVTLSRELTFSKERITKEVKEAPVSFATPFGQFDERVIAEVKKHYDFHFEAWGGNEGFNPILIQDRYAIGRFEVEVGHSAVELCNAVVQASKEGKWLVLEFHEVVDRVPSEYQISTKTFEGVVQCVLALQEQGRIEVKTAKEHLVPQNQKETTQ